MLNPDEAEYFSNHRGARLTIWLRGSIKAVSIRENAKVRFSFARPREIRNASVGNTLLKACFISFVDVLLRLGGTSQCLRG